MGEAGIGEGMGTAVNVHVTKGHAYVVALSDAGPDAGGLFVFDLKDRTAPRLVKSVHIPRDAYWNSVWAKDDALYVASASRGVLVFDIGDGYVYVADAARGLLIFPEL